jgi:hypothetical protein
MYIDYRKLRGRHQVLFGDERRLGTVVHDARRIQFRSATLSRSYLGRARRACLP